MPPTWVVIYTFNPGKVKVGMAMMYEIRVKGHLDPRSQEWLGGFSLTLSPGGVTVLKGQVLDQAALYGLLLRIRDLGIPLLSVNESSPVPPEAAA